ncbi:signal peptide peptidase SppA [Candidatus Woesearchaeota archaeon]|nr:signal peptide peptidase SppA [Candidatus Woesearchaeota archaeon]
MAQKTTRDNNAGRIVLIVIAACVGVFLITTLFIMLVGVAMLFAEPLEEGNVAVVEVKGTITGDDAASLLGGGASATRITRLLAEADDDPAIDAVVLDINSGGGTPVGSAEIAAAVRELDKPTVAWIRDSGASGAYWVAAAADHVVAHPLSTTGSIGVYGSYLEWSGTLTRYNATYQRLVSGEYKDVGSPFKELTLPEEVLLQAKLDRMHDYFISSVAEYRNMTYDEVAIVADGSFLLGIEAYEAGLVDELGGKEEVQAYLERELNGTVTLAYLRERASFVDVLYGVIDQHGHSLGTGLAEGLRRQDVMVRT